MVKVADIHGEGGETDEDDDDDDDDDGCDDISFSFQHTKKGYAKSHKA